jgi:Flp pilus assembly protein protease CpaA
MEDLLFFGALVGFSLASASDLKTREVPDYLSYFLLALGFLYRLLWSATLFPSESAMMVLLVPAVFSAGFGTVAYLLYKTGQWGGGDVKLIVAAAWLIGYFPSRSDGLMGTLFFLNFFMNLIVFGTLYTILYTISKGVLKGSIERWRIYLLLAGTFGGFMSMVILQSLPLSISVLLPIAILAASGIPFFKDAEDKCFIKDVPPSKLTEGDWLVGEIEGVPKRGEGLTGKDIEKIKSMNVRKVRIKEGVPFVPAFLIALVATWLGIYFLPIAW